MNKKLVIVLLVIVVIGCVVFSINMYDKETENKKDEIALILGDEPNSLDPAISLTIDVRSYMSTLFEGLMSIDEKGNLQEGVAYKYESNDDNTEFTFFLRDNAKWSDGSLMTANDFKFAWLRVLNPETASGWASYLYYIKGAEDYNIGKNTKEDVGIEVVDDLTLKVVLENPCSFFPSMTALQPYYPVKEAIIQEKGDKWCQSSQTYITNGAFKLDNWEHDSVITVVKNENYWNSDKTQLAKIKFLLFSDSSAILNAYEAGQVNYIESMLTSEEMNQVETIKFSDFVYTKFLAMNLKSEIFNNVNVRKAISLALDRKEISNIMGYDMEPLTSFIPYGFYNSVEDKDFTQDSSSKKYLDNSANIKEAKRLLKEAGYDEENKLDKIVYLTNTSSTNIALAEIIKNQLGKVGVEVQIQALESKVFNTYRKEKKFDLVAASWAAEYPDITSYLYGFKSNDLNNYSGFNSKEFDELYNAIISEPNIKDRYEMTHKAETLVMDEYCVAPLYSQKQSYIVNDNIKGFYHDITGCLNLNNAYIE